MKNTIKYAAVGADGMNLECPYQLDADMLGTGFAGGASDLHELVVILAEETGRPESDFIVRQHVVQTPGAVEPTEVEWTNALATFAERRPELFPEVY